MYVATPQLLATYGITAGRIASGTDVLTMRPGLASLPHMELAWGNYGVQQGPGGLGHKDSVLPACTLSSDCLAAAGLTRVSLSWAGRNRSPADSLTSTRSPHDRLANYPESYFRGDTVFGTHMITCLSTGADGRRTRHRASAVPYSAPMEISRPSSGQY